MNLTIHPFPARMAPDLALEQLKRIPEGARVMDPMAGSGTVLRQASALGLNGIGFDMDPLAVLMSSVATTPVSDRAIERKYEAVVKEAQSLRLSDLSLPWIDEDKETEDFVNYWFARPQRNDLRRLAFTLAAAKRSSPAINVLKIALSRIVVTKDQGASLARDVSHSRPHRVADDSNYDVFSGFERAVKHIRKVILEHPPSGKVCVQRGDARYLDSVANKSIDFILTSPPYLNAIDYMRGHRLALVWLGYRLTDLRSIRSSSIGAERGPDEAFSREFFEDIVQAMGVSPSMSSRHLRMVDRYAEDLYRLMSEMSRVMKPSAKAVLVVGNSCLRGTFIRNSDGVRRAATMVGLKFQTEMERKLPDNRRYLPPPRAKSSQPLDLRMRTEAILVFSR